MSVCVERLESGRWVPLGSFAEFARERQVSRQAAFQAAARGGTCCGVRLRMSTRPGSARQARGGIAVISSDGMWFPSWSAAARFADVPVTTLRSASAAGRDAGGRRFVPADSLPIDVGRMLVLCRERPACWVSARCAADAVGCTLHEVLSSIRTGEPVRGMTFSLVGSGEAAEALA